MKPCPWCGNTPSPTVVEGSTFRWRQVRGCCTPGPEVRHDTMTDDQAAAEIESTQRALAAWDERAPLDTVLSQVQAERDRQDAKWGVQDWPSVRGVGDQACKEYNLPSEAQAKRRCDEAFDTGRGTYADIALEEFCEVVNAPDDAHRREELIQLAAVCVAWVQTIDRKQDKEA